MPRQHTNAEKIRALPWALGGDATNSVFVNLSFAGPVFLLFLDKMELDKTQIGLVLSIIPFCGLVAMFTAPAVAWVGYKRTYLTAMAARTVVWLLLLATPWVFSQWGRRAAFYYVVAAIFLFALCRSVGFSAFGPWVQEFVPNRVRGRFSAAQNVVFVVFSASTLAAAGGFLGVDPEPKRFTFLFMLAIGAGFLSAVLYGRVPGGASTRGDTRQRSDYATMGSALRDRQFRLFLLGSALATLGWAPLGMGAFLPLYLKDQIGLRPDQVLYFNAVLLGSGVVSCFVWGWAADRYGSKPALLLTLAILCLYPIGLWMLPANEPFSYSLALLVSVVVGLALPGWGIAYSRLLYVKLIPSDKRSGYSAVHWAWMGVVSGMAPLIAGRVLEATSNLQASWGFMRIDPYTPLMWSGMVFMGLSFLVLSRLTSDSGVPVSRFAGMFIQGNALAAMQALIAHRLGGVEEKRVTTIERLGQTRSPFGVDELIGGLSDPGFNVRFEAVVSIARTRPDARLTEALIKVLRGGEPDMCIAAAWALGRLGDRSAIEPLREALDSDYPLLRARAARALGTLSDHASAQTLLKRMTSEPDPGIKLAYASALGALRRTEALGPLLEILDTLREDMQRRELALAVASIAGRDDWFVKLARSAERDPGDTLAGVLLSMKRRLLRGVPTGDGLGETIDHCVSAFGDNDMAGGVKALRQIVQRIGADQFTPPAAAVLSHACARLEQDGAARMDYAMLCIHILHSGYGAAAAGAADGGSAVAGRS